MQLVHRRTETNLFCVIAVGLAVITAILQTGWWYLMASSSTADIHNPSVGHIQLFIIRMAVLALVFHCILILLSVKWRSIGGCIYVMLGFSYLLFVSPDWSGVAMIAVGLMFIVSLC